MSTAELAAAKQQHQNQRSGDTSGSHTQAEGTPGWAVPVGSWLGRGSQAGGIPQHTEPVFATLYFGVRHGIHGQAGSCTKASVPDAGLSPPRRVWLEPA